MTFAEAVHGGLVDEWDKHMEVRGETALDGIRRKKMPRKPFGFEGLRILRQNFPF